MERKNILIIAAVFPPEPIVSANLMRDLAEVLSKSHNVTVLCPPPTRPLGFKMVNNRNQIETPYRIVEVDSYTCAESKLFGRFWESLSLGRQAAKFVNEHYNEIDFVYNATWPLMGKHIVSKALVKHNIPYVTPVQDIYPESLSNHLPKGFISKVFNKIFLPMDKYRLKNAEFIHVISDKMADYLSKSRQIEREKFLVVCNWQNEAAFIKYHENKAISKPKDERITFMYLGNVGPLAGLELVIDAFKEAELDNSRLVIAGSGSAKQNLENKVNEERIKNVEFWDVPDGKVPEVQDKADVMVLPIKKGFATFSIPSKLPAYMFSKKPVLASVDKESDTALCIKDADCGWIVEPEDKMKLIQIFRNIVKLDKSMLEMKGNKGFEFALTKLSKSYNLDILHKAIISKLME